MDTTVIRLLDGKRVYLHGIIDNYSRRILAWKVSERLEPANTAAILLEAARGVLPHSDKPTVLADGGVENFNPDVNALIEDGLLRRLLAMTDVTFSNSMIESCWRSLKHQWLFLNELDTLSTLAEM